MTLISVGFVQAIEIWLRYLITYKININAAGYWTAMNGVPQTIFYLFLTHLLYMYFQSLLKIIRHSIYLRKLKLF